MFYTIPIKIYLRFLSRVFILQTANESHILYVFPLVLKERYVKLVWYLLLGIDRMALLTAIVCITLWGLLPMTHMHMWWIVCQKQVSRAGTSNYIPQILWDVITCPCPWYLPLAHTSSYNLICKWKWALHMKPLNLRFVAGKNILPNCVSELVIIATDNHLLLCLDQYGDVLN